MGMRINDLDLARVLSVSSEAAITVSEGKIEYMNNSARELFGAFYIGTAIKELLPEHVASAERELLCATLRHSDKDLVLSSVHVDQHRVYIIRPLDATETTDFASRFLPLANSVLTNMRFAADRLNMSGGTPEKGDVYPKGVLNHSIAQFRRMLTNIKVSEGVDTPFEASYTDMVVLCRDICLACEYFAKTKGIALNFESDAECLYMHVDRSLTEQLLLNLISNSLMGSSEGDKISVGLRKVSDNIILSVDDTGKGIAAGDLVSIINGTVKMGLVREQVDMGIGLKVVRKIADMHGGHLVIESRETVGTSVRVLYPKKEQTNGISFRGPKTEYRLDGKATVMVQLSSWMQSDEYQNEDVE